MVRLVNVLKLIAYGAAVLALDLAVEAVAVNQTFVKTLKSLL